MQPINGIVIGMVITKKAKEIKLDASEGFNQTNKQKHFDRQTGTCRLIQHNVAQLIRQ